MLYCARECIDMVYDVTYMCVCEDMCVLERMCVYQRNISVSDDVCVCVCIRGCMYVRDVTVT